MPTQVTIFLSGTGVMKFCQTKKMHKPRTGCIPFLMPEARHFPNEILKNKSLCSLGKTASKTSHHNLAQMITRKFASEIYQPLTAFSQIYIFEIKYNFQMKFSEIDHCVHWTKPQAKPLIIIREDES